MDLLRCKNNHFYDGDKYEECPHCKEMENELKSTVPNDQDFVMRPNVEAKEDVHTNSLFGLLSKGSTQNKSEEPIQNDNIVPEFDSNIMPKASSLSDDTKTVSYYGKNEPVVGWLVCVSGEHYGEDFKLKCGMNYVGRLPSMDVPLIKDKGVSREKHITIIYDPKGKVFTAYMGESKELVYVNETLLLTPIKLEPYDKISIGKSILILIPLCGEKFIWEEYDH